jgi:putative tryptophan/tyrosine transport system substrate-binding protein
MRRLDRRVDRRLERRRLLRAGGAAGLGLAAWPLLAQRPALPRVGVLYPGAQAGSDDPAGALSQLRAGLRQHGLEDGRTVELLVRYEALQPARASTFSTELQQAGVAVIVAGTGPAAAMARRAAPGLPIVFAASADPVADGLVASLALPGGQVTGLSLLSAELTPRRLQLLTEMVPGLRRVALLLDSGFPRWRAEREDHAAASQRLGLQLQPLAVAGPADFDAAFATALADKAQALVLMQCPLFNDQKDELAARALRARLPSVSGSGDGLYARSGGLMNYGVSIPDNWRRAADYVERILRGARPADLPVQQPTRFEFVINRRTADTLGLAVPQHLLLLADAVLR